jgi:hypothetical protein
MALVARDDTQDHSGPTRCLTCGVEPLDRDHLDWCVDKVRRRGEGVRPRTDADLHDLLERLTDRSTIGDLRHERTNTE